MVEASPIFRFAQFITFSDYYLFHPLFFQTLLFAFISLSLSGVIVVSILFLLLLVLSVSAIFSFSHSFNSYFVYTFFSRVSVILSSVTMCVCVCVSLSRVSSVFWARAKNMQWFLFNRFVQFHSAWRSFYCYCYFGLLFYAKDEMWTEATHIHNNAMLDIFDLRRHGIHAIIFITQ